MTAADSPVNADSQSGDLLSSRVGWVIGGTILSSLVYAATVASKGRCAGGSGADGGHIDAAGNATDAVPLCLNLQLRPNTAVQVAIVLIAIVGLVVARILQRDAAKALSVLGVTLAVTAIMGIGGFALGHSWFNAVSLEDWDGSPEFSGQLPVLVVDVTETITPMGGP